LGWTIQKPSRSSRPQLQDRLVEELRLHRISTRAAANAFAEAYMADYNRCGEENGRNDSRVSALSQPRYRASLEDR
jgi:hypothetical protein